ncbi:pectinesterase family protein [Granulicella mallensis]|uniref:Pectin methylesterase-like acyl-CoA thioesterase n=1 Tax=Granulicella mallensis TaxID=940614 RepID=A0A7W8E9D3_9BACT|nr:pectinesterase family protein [Granulicella mallensis]MBB5062240.1 pectin methylesterase-like acyl-CoA thioesterase [Granulicella mallensis]
MALRSSPFAVSIRSSLELVASSIRQRLKIAGKIGGLAAVVVLAGSNVVSAQTPVLFPNTISSVAGNTPVVSTPSAACPTNGQFTATDATGNGCPAVNATLPSVVTGIAVDPSGNIYISANSTNPQIIRKIDARTGIISAYAGAYASQCVGSGGVKIYGTKAVQNDKLGDGCPVTYTSGFNGPVSLGTDAYGNLLIGTTGDNALHMVCNAVSPICTSAMAGENVMIGAVECTVAGGTTSFASAVAGTTVGSAGDGTVAAALGVAACSATAAPPVAGVGGRIYAPTGDRWDNIYFMDGTNGRIRVVAGPSSITVNGASVPNPLYAALQTTAGVAGLSYSSPEQGFVYPIAGGAVAGTVCSGNTDAGGDGCPFYQTLVNTGSTGGMVQGTAVDHDGDFLFDDGLGRLRIIYMGGTIIKGALAANGITSPQVGFSYVLIGGGTAINFNSANPGIVLGKSAALQSGAVQTLAIDPAGNILIGDQEQILFYDIATGYVRRITTASGATSCNTSALGDGCPANQFVFGANGTTLPVAEDVLGNLYMLDIANARVRRLSAQTLPSTTVTSAGNTATLSSSLTVHAPVVGSTVTITAPAGSDFTVGSATCTTNTSSDGSVDCTAPVTYAPTMLAQRAEPVSIATTAGSATATQDISLNAISTGSALVFDTAGTPATSVLGAATTGNTAVVLDGAGNAYVSGTQGISKVTGSTVTNISAIPAAYLAVDTAGSVYAAAAGSTTITKYVFTAATGKYSPQTISIPSIDICTTTVTTISCALTQANSGPMVVDTNGLIYIADVTSRYVEKFSPTTGVGSQLNQIPLTSPTAMGMDSYGNLLVVDGTSVFKIPAGGIPVTTTSPTENTVVTFSPVLSNPTSVTADQGENIYVADGGSIKVQSLSGGQYTIPGVSGSAVAVDGAGNLYTTATVVAGITEVLRSSGTFNFGTSITTTDVGVFSNTGASAPTGFGQTDTGGNFTAAVPATPLASAAPTCNLTSTVLLGGSLCNVSLSFTPTANGNGAIQDAITLLPETDTLGSLVLNGTKTGTNATTTTAITGGNTGLTYTAGTEATFTVTVSESPAAIPSGTVAVTIDGGAAVNYPLTGATASTAAASVPVAGLIAAAHSIVATYGNSPGIVGSTSATTNFAIGQATSAVNWTPSATTQQYSAAVGTAVLDAAATSTAIAGNIAGAFIYTATPSSGGTTVPIHSASYLPIGTYSLGVTFVPNDAVDYAPSTATIGTYTVTKATTTAAVGVTQMLVAADGSGNFSTVQSAVDALPSGGSIYIKPGTYNAFITVVQPNIALRGLGGDSTKVILTHGGGAFGSTYPYIGEFQATNSNGSQMQSGSTVFTGDEGSATLVVAKGINAKLGATQQTPNGFYAENLSLINTYDTDATTTTTTYASSSGGACALGQTPAMTYAALYNSGQLCASQALVIWTNSDLSIMNNIYATSLQDTVYTASPGSGSNGFVPTRQYWFRGKISGDVDYIFGDAAAVFDSTSIYTAFHGATATGTETIEAQNKMTETGSSGDYLSGYIMNNDVFTSQAPGMTNLFLGRPYGTFSTWILLNSYIDQTNPAGYTTGLGPSLTSATYGEYNDLTYTDPATGSADLNGNLYLGLGGNSGSGVSGPRETTSTNPGTAMANNNPPVTMSQAQAQAYFPTNFLSQTVPSSISTTTNWNPTAALASAVNTFIPAGTTATVASGTSVTILMRPQTPGLGAITNGVYTIPTGSYTLTDSINGGTATTIASGPLDASGEAYFTSSNLTAGSHNLSWTYSGDANFSGSTTAAAYVLTVTGSSTVATTNTTTTLSATATTAVSGTSIKLTATIAPAASSTTTPTGTVTFMDGATTLGTGTVASGMATYTTSTLAVGPNSITAVYGGDTNFAPSTSAALSITITAAVQSSFTLGLSPTSGTVTSGSMATSTITITPSGGFNQQVSFACSGLPQNASCSFSPATVTPSGTGTATSTLTIATGTASAALYQHQPALPGQGSGGTSALAFLGGGGFLAWTLLRRRKSKSLWYVQLGLALMIVVASATVGCGGGSMSTPTPPTATTTPAGTYQVTITGTAGSATQTATYSLTVQ